jgi:tetratricopeptide (TPR) repeat protein
MAQGFSVEQMLRAADNAYRAGNLADALMLCRGALELDPRNAQGTFMLGALLALQGNLPEALGALKKAVEIAPDFPEANLQLVMLLRKTGRLEEAVEACVRFVLALPSFTAGHTALGACFFESGRISEATEAFRGACALDPRSYEAWVGLGRALLASRRPKDAAGAFKSALAINDSDAMCHATLGQALQEAGAFEESVSHFNKAISLDPGLAQAYLGLVLGKKISNRDDPLPAKIREQLARSELNDQDRGLLEYALGKALDDLGEHQQALECFDRATEITVRLTPAQAKFDPQAEAAGIDFTLKTFTKEFFFKYREIGLESELPVFVVGAPRSGTTLVEQMLTNHPAIGSAGEQPFWVENGRSAFEALSAFPETACQTAQRYLELLGEICPGKARVIDKMPTNYTSLGLLMVLFPKARIIHCRRHPVDTCLSLYMNAHSISPMPFGNTRGELVGGYLGYLRVMEHWRQVLPGDRFLEMGYEELVSDPEPVLRRVVAGIGLEWDESCLHPETNEREVSTPSRWQVRQPVYRSSVERWRRYEPWLGEFRKLLG